ncbi:hypothetical protein C0J52_09358 [Blattella germanica]|nr:hypothetical protein C0J52_09358 [Blattella germanica]
MIRGSVFIIKFYGSASLCIDNDINKCKYVWMCSVKIQSKSPMKEYQVTAARN